MVLRFYAIQGFMVLWFYAIQGSMVLWFYDSILFKVLWQQLQDELRRTKWSKIRWNHQQSNPANWVSDVRRTDPRTVKHTNTPNQENMIITDSCVWSGLTSGTNLWGQLFKCNLMGFWSSDWIKSWKCVVQKTKKRFWIRIRSQNILLVLIWIKSTVCVVQKKIVRSGYFWSEKKNWIIRISGINM